MLTEKENWEIVIALAKQFGFLVKDYGEIALLATKEEMGKEVKYD